MSLYIYHVGANVRPWPAQDPQLQDPQGGSDYTISIEKN